MTIKIDVIPTVNETRIEQINGKTVIVIDVLRASSTIVTSFMQGCTEIIPVETSGQAYGLRDANTILVGERFCKKIQGFDFSNSPYEILNNDLQGKRIILSTTNGTIAIHKASKGEHVLIGSFLNGEAVANAAYKLKNDITLLCAGTRNQFALEDALCAGYIISRLQAICPMEWSDLAWMCCSAYQQMQHDLTHTLPKTTTGMRLVQYGLLPDLEICAQKGISGLVPYLKDDRIIVQPLS